RVGVATGMVVSQVGGEEREQTVVGETPNLAARLQALAAPGTVLVGPVTRQLTGDFFEYVSAGEHSLKGFDAPVTVWEVRRELNVESRFAAAHSAFSGPIVAREREQAFLLDSWQRAARGSGHLVLLGGEAGMGKSRLLEALVDGVQTTLHRLLRCQCSPYHRNSALYPLIQLLRHEAPIEPERSLDENLHSLEVLLSQAGRASRRDLLLIAELLELPTRDRVSPMEMTPAQRNAEIVAILEDLVLATPDGAPVLFLVEDAHWSDPTTQSLVERLLGRIESSSVLAVITHRPEFSKNWSDRAQATALTCKPLGRDQCAAIARYVAGDCAIDDALIEQIVKRSDGVPLYVEELTKAVIDMQTAVVVPSTLRDSLMSRLDRLGDAKEIALVASVIGRRFSFSMLAEIAGVKEATLEAALGRLLGAGLVFAVEDSAQRDYSFNHSLVQEAAYETLSNSRRQALHLSIAVQLEAQTDTEAASAPEIIAYHFGRAAEPEKACAFWMLAAEKSRQRTAFVEAIANLGSALAEAERIADVPTRLRSAMEVQLRRGAEFVIQSGPLSADGKSALERAYALAKELKAEPQLFQATWGLYSNAANSRQFDRARLLGDELLEIGRKFADDDFQVEGLHHRWGYWYFTGKIASMFQYTREGIARYDSRRHHRFAHVFAGHDLGVCAHCCEAIGLGLGGRSQGVAASVEAAISLADSLQHPPGLAYALGMASVALQLGGDNQASADMAQREIRVAEKYDLPLQRALGLFMLGLARTHDGDMAGLATMEANYEAAMRRSHLGVYPDVALVDALARAGRGEEALTRVTRTLEALPSPEIGVHVSELWRMRGELLLAQSAAHAGLAESCLRAAVRVVSDQDGATVYQARAESAL
ncbi:MAG: AAA family ATPase, partial [Caldimonas sp.]